MPTISVRGRASGRRIGPWKIDTNVANQQSLMEFLIYKGVPIASSCAGEGQCLKCSDSRGHVTCQTTPLQYFNDYGDTLELDYL